MTFPEAPPGTIFQARVGSHAYGMAGPESDEDYLGIYLERTEAFLGLTPLTVEAQSLVRSNPDRTYHELGKACRLLCACNPTVTELLWLESDFEASPAGLELRSLRGNFLSAKLVRNAYLGYATQQLKRLERRGDGSFSSDTRKRTRKHARHLMRLVFQGLELYTTGKLTVQLRPDQIESINRVGDSVDEGDLTHAEYFLKFAEVQFDDIRTVLPEKPNTRAINDWLVDVRYDHLAGELGVPCLA